MNLEKLISDNPALHLDVDGTLVNWAVNAKVLKAISGFLKPGMVTLETGSGHTTIAFGMAGTRHICISPFRDEQQRIQEYLDSNSIKHTISFLTGSSDTILAAPGVVPDELDFVFIDGAHRFPFPCVDFHFTEEKLKVGGIMCVDDVHMPSVRILYDFLVMEKEWELVKKVKNTAFFKRIKPTEVISDWQGQVMNGRFKKMEGLKTPIKKAIKKLIGR
ncbi:MAG: class I SAM-dependent methyltransferase [Bacteroidota bacterium]